MCECSWTTCRPTAELLITVRHCFDHQRWSGHVGSIGVTVGDQIIKLATGSHEFGPFDSSTEVGYWICRQSAALKALVHPDMFRKLAES